jgi:hypothetical protein
MHETAINNGVILKDYLVAVTALQALLITIALMGTILYLLEVPYRAKLASCCNQMALLLPILCDLPKFFTHIMLKLSCTDHHSRHFR